MLSRSRSAILLAVTLCASACEGAKPPATKSDAQKPAASEPAAKPPEPAPSRTPAVVVEAEGEAPAAAEVPAWFDADAIEHEAVVNQMASKGQIAGGQAKALLLELKPGTTPEQCIEMARAAIGKTVPEVPEAGPADQGRTMLQGRTDSYHYTAVCGDANGKPTMYLSYTTQ